MSQALISLDDTPAGPLSEMEEMAERQVDACIPAKQWQPRVEPSPTPSRLRLSGIRLGFREEQREKTPQVRLNMKIKNKFPKGRK